MLFNYANFVYVPFENLSIVEVDMRAIFRRMHHTVDMRSTLTSHCFTKAAGYQHRFRPICNRSPFSDWWW